MYPSAIHYALIWDPAVPSIIAEDLVGDGTETEPAAETKNSKRQLGELLISCFVTDIFFRRNASAMQAFRRGLITISIVASLHGVDLQFTNPWHPAS